MPAYSHTVIILTSSPTNSFKYFLTYDITKQGGYVKDLLTSPSLVSFYGNCMGTKLP